MYVRRLALRDFRSWSHIDLELTPGRTVFVGANGFGKTNLVEALWYCATLGSHRVATDAPLIRSGAQRAVVSTIVVNEGRELAVDIEIAAGRANKARLNRSPVRSTAKSSVRCVRCCSHRRIFPWCGVIQVSDGVTSTNSQQFGAHGSPGFGPIMTRFCGNARHC